MTTKEILVASIQDIKDGLWTCGQLTCDVPGNPEAKKPMGCALGLVGINAGLAQYDKEYQEWILDYPEDAVESPWTDEAMRAVDLLAETVDLDEEILEDLKLVGHDAGAIVVTYNDGTGNGKRLTPEDAVAWFTRAAELA